MRYKIFCFTIFFFTFFQESFSQYELDWVRTWGARDSNDMRTFLDDARCMVETSDGGIVVAGSSAKSREKYIAVVKFSKYGELLWNRVFKNDTISSAESILETKDGCLLVAGYCWRPSSPHDMQGFVVKLNQNGKTVWEKMYGGQADDAFRQIIKLKESGFAVTGYNYSNPFRQANFWLVKLNEDGTIIWENTYGGSRDEMANCLVQTYDGGFAMAGLKKAWQDSTRIFLVRVDASGQEISQNELWHHEWDVGSSMVETTDSGIVIVGYSRTVAIIDYDVFMMKLNKNGNEVWRRIYGWSDWEEATSVVQTYDDDLAVAGFLKSANEQISNFWVVKFNKYGKKKWGKVYETKSLDYVNTLIETKDKGLVLAGSTYIDGLNGWDFAILKFSNVKKSEFNFETTFDTRYDSIMSVTKDTVLLELCANGISQLDSMKIFINNSLFLDSTIVYRDLPDTIPALQNDSSTFDSVFFFYIDSTISSQEHLISKCDVPIKKSLPLSRGKNTIIFEATDKRGQKFRIQRIIFYLPVSALRW